MIHRVLTIAALCAPAVFAQEQIRIVPRESMPPAQMAPSARDLTPDAVSKLERLVASTPEDMWARRSLLEYYYLNGMRNARLPHIYWMIEHHPEDDAISRGLCDLAPDTPLATRSDYEYGRSLWLAQTAKNPDNARVRQNAARYFDPYDLQLAIENLQAAVRAPNNAGVSARMQLARLYSRILRATLAPPIDPGERPYLADPALLTRIKSDLENTSDVQMLMLIGGLPDPEFTAKLSARIRTLNPDGAVASLPAGTPIPGSIRVGGNVQASKLIRQPAPEYPALAKQARIQGTVRFTVVIGKDGTVQNMTLVSGHPLLVPPAQEAVRQWVYQPTLLNGNPVDVITTVDVNFTLSDSPAPPLPSQPTPQ